MFRMTRSSSRLASQTSKYFDAAASTTAATSRRLTRASLARFAYSTDESTKNEVADAALTLGSDIEDAVTTVTRKRKRTDTLAATDGVSKPAQPTPRARVAARRATTVKIEEVKIEEADRDPDATTPARSRGRARKPARKTTDPTTGAVSITPPTDWEEMYAVAKEMRLHGAAANAAVDTMGCERLAQRNASARDRRFQTLVALMLSSQTKDTVNAEAMARLQNELPPYKEGAPPGLNLENMLAVEPKVLNELIGKVGFHNNKTKYLKQTAEILQRDYNSDIPNTIEGLTSLPGVGPKMAHLCMSAEHGWNRVEGIGVDVHVHRITNLWGWNGAKPTKTPEETRAALQSWLPRDKWKEINWLLVGLGQTVCLPVGRRCGDYTGSPGGGFPLSIEPAADSSGTRFGLGFRATSSTKMIPQLLSTEDAAGAAELRRQLLGKLRASESCDTISEGVLILRIRGRAWNWAAEAVARETFAPSQPDFESPLIRPQA
ncbi:hypothetical protein VTJ49DRAFT_4575 [Mycothermus thermophilus]|uniref:Endonuclease III homolog n=1 Tax=Humicola insolens TaxID=85995 RepID=A0ABR3VLA2_HUMIN